MMLENENIPKIRFKGFTKPWERRKLGDIADKVIEKNADLVVQETFTNSAEFGIISQRDFFDHDISNAENIDGYYVVKDEDFVYNPRISVTAPVGPINRNKLGRNGVMSPLYTVFHTHDIDTTYLEWSFKSSYWHSFMHYNGDSGARSDRFSIKDAVFFEMPIPYPSLEEQREIGIWMSQLDKIITLHKCKCEKLKQIKKSMLEKMFPHEGKNVPEIRFKEFTEPWKRCKLSEFLEVSTEKNTDVLSVSGDYGIVNQIEFQGRSFAGALVSNYGVVHTGDVVYTKSPLKATPYGIIKANQGNTGIVSVLYGVYHTKKNANADFIQMYFEQDARLNDYLRPLVNKGAKNTLLISDSDALEGEVCFAPTFDEQEVIGQFFSIIDKLITFNNKKYEKLKQIKKSLLEKMFAQ